MDYLQSIRLFLAVAEMGSFAAAAGRHNISTAAVSRGVVSLEERFNARLLHRSTRKLSLTEAGDIFFCRIREIVSQIDDIEGELTARSSIPGGSIRIAVQGGLGAEHTSRMLAEFIRKYPDVVPHVTFVHGRVDFVHDGFDVAIMPEDFEFPLTFVVRRIGREPLLLVGADSYVTGFDGGKNTSATIFTCLDPLVEKSGGGPLQWLVERFPEAKLRNVNNCDVVRMFALQGLGLGLVPASLVGHDVSSGALQTVPAGGPYPELGLSVAYASRRNMPASVRAFVDFLVEGVKVAGAWRTSDSKWGPAPQVGVVGGSARLASQRALKLKLV